MDIVLMVAAIVIAAVALGLGFELRRRLTRLAHDLEAVRRDLNGVRDQLNTVENDLTDTRRELERGMVELGELKVAANVLAAPPPLPRPRAPGAGGLDDLRQRLRAAHTEADPSEE